jgi:hypothetical protein
VESFAADDDTWPVVERRGEEDPVPRTGRGRSWWLLRVAEDAAEKVVEWPSAVKMALVRE